MQNKPFFLRIFNFIAGPWPIHPVGFAIIAGFLNQFSGVRVAVSHGQSTAAAWIHYLPSSLAMSALLWAGFAFTTWVINRATRRGYKQIAYLGLTLLIAAIFAVIFGIYDKRDITDAPLNTLRMYLVILTVSTIFGISENRIRRQATRAEEALSEVDRQRSLLLQADESTRREVADFLHDRVQAGLVVATMELNNIAEKLSEQHRSEIKSVVEELEEIRRFDVRDASRLLSPDIAVVGLERCLTDLTTKYRDSMNITVNVNFDLSLVDAQHQLAIYRIIEQGLLNAAVHGHAAHCTVEISTNNGCLIITVLNDGHPLAPDQNASGSGTAVIDAWTSQFSGEWSLTMNESAYVILRAKIPY